MPPFLTRRREVAIFYRQLGTACRAGIPLTQGLRMAASGCRKVELRRAAEDIEKRVSAGNPLGPALEAHPEVFREVETALVAVGEQHGILDQNLARLADAAEKEHHDVQGLVLSLLYPVGLFVAALFLPKLFVLVQHGLAAYLVSVLATALPFLLVLGALGAGAVALHRAAPETFDRIRLLLPVLGPNLKKRALARFSDSLAMLYAGGAELRKSLGLAIRAIGNRYLIRRCEPIATVVEHGGSLSDGLAAAGVFPPELIQTVAVGEKTGDLDQTLGSMARLYEAEAERATKTLLTLLPIGIYLLVALYIAIVVISAFGAYFRLVGNV